MCVKCVCVWCVLCVGDEPEGEVVSEDRHDEALHDVVVVTDSKKVNRDNNIEQVSSNSHQHLSIS